MKLMHANEYAEHSGYPLETIKQFCKDGTIPSDRIGRKYLINVELADEILLNRQIKKVSIQERPLEKPKKKTFNFIESLNSLSSKKCGI